MKYLRIIFFAMALIMAATPAFASSASLGLAGNYNAFVFGNFTTSSDTEGRLAVGGNMHVSNYSVGDKLASGDTDNVLVVGGDMTFMGGSIYGDAHIGGTITDSGNSTTYYGVRDHATPINFSAEQQKLNNLSSSLSALAATGTVANNWGGFELTGDSTSDTQVFTIDGSALLSGWGLNIAGGVDQTDTIIINVTGETAGFTGFNMEGLAAYASNIIFNFYEATKLQLAGVSVWGTILATSADVEGNNGNLNGTLIANSLEGPFEFHNVPFEGNVPTPIPGTLALLGTGLAGLLGWRRRR